MEWKTSPLVAHAARIAKSTLRVVAIDVGVADEVVSGGFKKGIRRRRRGDRENLKIRKRSPEGRKAHFSFRRNNY